MFGAHIFSQFLINFGLDTNKIICLLDNDISKQDRRLYGTDLYVRSPESISSDINPVVVLKAGAYNDEIRDQILTSINSSAIFI